MPLQGDRARLRNGRRLSEGELGRLESERGFRRKRVLREATFQPEVVAIHVISGAEPGDPFPDFIDLACDVRPERPASREPQPADPRVRGRSS
jgi:hypothetical protein